jgi:hypothetical protein
MQFRVLLFAFSLTPPDEDAFLPRFDIVGLSDLMFLSLGFDGNYVTYD